MALHETQHSKDRSEDDNDIITITIIIITIIIIIIIMSLRKYVSNIPGNHEVKEVQKTALRTAHIFRKVLT